eukprot:scaffold8104_cov34-Prasinocladus_malaysianus.AAC.1
MATKGLRRRMTLGLIGAPPRSSSRSSGSAGRAGRKPAALCFCRTAGARRMASSRSARGGPSPS